MSPDVPVQRLLIALVAAALAASAFRPRERRRVPDALGVPRWTLVGGAGAVLVVAAAFLPWVSSWSNARVGVSTPHGVLTALLGAVALVSLLGRRYRRPALLVAGAVAAAVGLYDSRVPLPIETLGVGVIDRNVQPGHGTHLTALGGMAMLAAAGVGDGRASRWLARRGAFDVPARLLVGAGGALAVASALLPWTDAGVGWGFTMPFGWLGVPLGALALWDASYGDLRPGPVSTAGGALLVLGGYRTILPWQPSLLASGSVTRQPGLAVAAVLLGGALLAWGATAAGR